jgi:hypothetical protein
MIKVLKSIGRAALIILGGLTLGVSLFAICNNITADWAIVSLVSILIGITAFIDYKINN